MSWGSDRARLVAVVSGAVFLETVFYAVITPLLPGLSHHLRLSKLAAGVMTAGYPAGTLVGALPAGALAVRRGPRFALISGLLLVAISTVGFGLLNSAVGLDLARFVEGLGGSCAWAGGLAWIIAFTPVQQRGAVIGKVLGTSIAGALLGPAVGALASATGRAALFGGLALVGSLLLVPIAGLRDAQTQSAQPVAAMLREVWRPDMRVAMWLMLLPAAVSGVINVLGPLQLHRLGAGAGMIGAVFLLSAGIEAVISPRVGRFSDRHGGAVPLRIGLLGAGVGLACFSLGRSTTSLALILLLISVPLGLFWAPVMALLSELADASGIDQAHAAALTNLAWALGQLLGSAGAGAAAKGFGDAAPTLFVAAICLLTLAGLRRRAAVGQAPA